MRPNEMMRIARASSAGFAMPITAQIEEDTSEPSRPDRDWARRMLQDLQQDEDVFRQVQDVGPENVVPTDDQRSQIEMLKGEFPGPMNMDEFGEIPPPTDESIDDLGGDYEDDDYPMREDDPRYQNFKSEVDRIDEQKRKLHEKAMLREKLRKELGPDADMFRDLASSNPSRLIRLAAHLDSLGLHQVADDLDTAAEIEIEDLLESFAGRGRGPGKGFGTGRGRGLMDGSGPRGDSDECPLSEDDDLDVESRKRLHLRGPRGTGRGKGTGPRSKDGTCPFVGKPRKNASVRTAQAQLAEVGLDEDDVEIDAQDDQAQIVSFDPDRGNMIVQTPDEIFKLYKITGRSQDGKPRFEFERIIDSPDDRVADYTNRLKGGNPSLEDYGDERLPGYLDQLSGGNPDIQQAYASRR